jgi:glycosyltransferase involved in cell wall biosynthesis
MAGSTLPPVRIAVYTDYAYREHGGDVFAERAFSLFLVALAPRFSRFLLVGRLTGGSVEPRYPISEPIEFVPLPYYRSLARPLSAGRAMVRSVGAFWAVLEEVDVVWVLGPHPLSIVFALLAAARRRRVVLGVRQDLPEYVRTRHRRRRLLRLAAWALDGAYRLLARACATVAVGPTIAERYRGARRLLELTVSLVRADDLIDPEEAASRRRDGGPTILSVGRLEAEKNPLLLADVLAELRADADDWRLVVCGEGPLDEDLRRRMADLGVAEHAEMRGYVPFGDAMLDTYRQADCLLHVSWTEGLPGVIAEAMAVGVPVVATDVGGIRGAVGDAALLVPPGDAAAAAAAVRRVRTDATLRAHLIRAGLAFAASHTLESEVAGLAEFIGR